MIEEMVSRHGKTVTTERFTTSDNSIGGQVQTWIGNLVLKGVIRPYKAQPQMIASQNQESITHTLYVVGTPDIEVKDRVKTTDNAVYEVVNVVNPMLFDRFLQIEMVYKGYLNDGV